MITTVKKNILHPVVANEDGLKRVVRILCDTYKSIKFTVECDNGKSFETSSLEDVIGYENLLPHQISKISISARNPGEFDEHADVTIDSNWLVNQSRSAVVTVVSQKPGEAEHQFARLVNAIHMMQPKYNWLARIPAYAALFAVSLMSMAYHVYTRAYNVPRPVWTISGSDLILLVLLLFAAMFGLMWLLHRLRSRIWPMVFFALGHQKQEFEKRDAIRAQLAWLTLALTIVFGLLVNWIYDHMKK